MHLWVFFLRAKCQCRVVVNPTPGFRLKEGSQENPPESQVQFPSSTRKSHELREVEGGGEGVTMMKRKRRAMEQMKALGDAGGERPDGDTRGVEGSHTDSSEDVEAAGEKMKRMTMRCERPNRSGEDGGEPGDKGAQGAL